MSLFIILNITRFKLIDLLLLLNFDWISSLFMSLVLFISRLVFIYSELYIEEEKNKIIFMWVLLIFVFSIMVIIVSLNLFRILLGWDGLGLVSYCLVIYYQNERRNRAGMITVLINRLGDIRLILRVIFIINFYSWGFKEFILERRKFKIIGLLVMFAAVTKSAQLPFRIWLPAAIAAPTPVSSLVHSSTLVTAGVYLIIRFNEYFFLGEFRELLIFMSILTIFFSGLCAIVEIDIKKIIAYSTLRQLGVIIMILSIGNYELAYFHLLSHAVFKAILFLSSGRVIHGIIGFQDIRIIGIIIKISPFISLIIILSRLSLRGVLFLRGFYSKDLILEIIYFININYLFIFIIFLSTVFTFLYSLRIIYYSILKNNIYFRVFRWEENYKFNVPIIILGCLTVFWGRIFSWLFFPLPKFLFLSLEVKLLNNFLIIIGLLFFLIFLIGGIFYNYLLIFTVRMIFLSFLWTRILKFLFLFSNKYYKFDQIWFEVLGTEIVYKEINKMSVFFNILNLRGRIKYIFIIFILIMYFIFYYSYSLIKNIALKKLRYLFKNIFRKFHFNNENVKY